MEKIPSSNKKKKKKVDKVIEKNGKSVDIPKKNNSKPERRTIDTLTYYDIRYLEEELSGNAALARLRGVLLYWHNHDTFVENYDENQLYLNDKQKKCLREDIEKKDNAVMDFILDSTTPIEETKWYVKYENGKTYKKKQLIKPKVKKIPIETGKKVMNGKLYSKEEMDKITDKLKKLKEESIIKADEYIGKLKEKNNEISDLKDSYNAVESEFKKINEEFEKFKLSVNADEHFLENDYQNTIETLNDEIEKLKYESDKLETEKVSSESAYEVRVDALNIKIDNLKKELKSKKSKKAVKGDKKIVSEETLVYAENGTSSDSIYDDGQWGDDDVDDLELDEDDSEMTKEEDKLVENMGTLKKYFSEGENTLYKLKKKHGKKEGYEVTFLDRKLAKVTKIILKNVDYSDGIYFEVDDKHIPLKDIHNGAKLYKRKRKKRLEAKK